MTKVLFVVYDNDAYIGFPPMALAALAAYGRQHGIEVTIYNQDLQHYDDAHLTEHLDRHHYDIVGLSFVGAYYPYRKAKAISKAIHESKTKPYFVLGGHGPSPEPAYFLKLLWADAVVIGEGEETFIELVEALASQSSLAGVKGVAYRVGDCVYVNPPREPIDDLDSLPMPAYDLLPMETYRLRRDTAHLSCIGNRFSVAMLTGRGCKFNCNFCYRIDKGMRLRSTEAIVDEMNYLFRRWNIQHFMFYDDLLMESETRTMELCEAFIEHGPPNMTFICQGRLNYAVPNVLETMKRAGCAYIYYGIESFNDDMLRVMRKALTTEIIERGAQNTRDAGILFSPNIIFGNIGETEEHLQNSVDFLLRYDDCAQLRAIKPVTPYPGTPLYHYAISEGLLDGPTDFYENKHTNTDLMTVNFTPLSDDEFYEALYRANTQIGANYFAALQSRHVKTLGRLYHDRDASFRGFRHV